jgi:hypothetical protein
VRIRPAVLGIAILSGFVCIASAQNGSLNVPATVEAGSAFSIPVTGKGTFYIVGPGQALKQQVQDGQAVSFPADSLYNAGRYIAIWSTGSSVATGAFDVVPARQPKKISFLAKPSRLPVGLHNGISGTVYVFDAYHNLITSPPASVTFQISTPGGATQQRTAATQNGVAWTVLDSTAKEGIDKFLAQVGEISSARIVEQVPGDPCGVKMSAKPAGQRLELTTEPIVDCSGNAVPDGTIVTFTENYNGTQSTVDVPIKRDIAQVEMPAHRGATISVASGVVLGNEIHWQ